LTSNHPGVPVSALSFDLKDYRFKALPAFEQILPSSVPFLFDGSQNKLNLRIYQAEYGSPPRNYNISILALARSLFSCSEENRSKSESKK